MKILDKIIVSPAPPTSKNVAWFDGKSIKMPSQGKWESAGGSGESPTSIMINVTYEELVRLRNEGKLTPGAKYRMTDYETTCTWENTQVAGHPFDLVLTALDSKALDEKCSAIWSERDTDGYFANSNLAAWDVRYCLDNDTERFDWAQNGGKKLTADLSQLGLSNSSAYLDGTFELNGTTYTKWNGGVLMGATVYFLTLNETPKYGDSILLYIVENGAVIGEVPFVSLQTDTAGKGVVYRLIDESENSVPYDFKNIMFSRPLTEGKYDAENGVNTFCYTFCCIDWDTYKIEDQSVKEPLNCYNNKFDVYCSDNVFLTFSGDNCNSNTFGDYCYSNTFGNSCFSNTFGYNCFFNTFGDNCDSNTFGDYCYSNTFGDYCYSNTFVNYCNSNTFGNNCYSNTFGSDCYSNTFGEHCYSNTFGNSCDSNTFGNSCYSNTFGYNCSNNTFGSNCEYNVFLTYCLNNIFGSSCQKNKFEAYCAYNTFDTSCSLNVLFANCSRNTFGPTCNSNVLNVECSYNTLSQYCSGNQLEVSCKNNTFGKYCLRNKLGSECSYNTFGSSSSNFYMSVVELKSKVQYVTFENSETPDKDIQFYTISNVAGTSSSRKSVTVQRNRTYQTYVTTKKDGTVVEYSVEDIINV